MGPPGGKVVNSAKITSIFCVGFVVRAGIMLPVGLNILPLLAALGNGYLMFLPSARNCVFMSGSIGIIENPFV